MNAAHNLFLLYAAELGLLGVGLWVLGLGLMVAGALGGSRATRSGPLAHIG